MHRDRRGAAGADRRATRARRPRARVEQAARAVTCLHATEAAGLYLSAFARSGASRDDVDEALQVERSVVRQLAAFPRDLLPAVLGSASARVAAQLAARLAKDVEAAGITREVPAESRYGADTPAGPRVLTVLAAGGSVVRGINNGGWKVSRPVWTPIEHWLDADPSALDEAAGYAELARRWLWSHGPGTEADLVWWLGATKTAVRRALADVEAVEVRLARTALVHGCAPTTPMRSPCGSRGRRCCRHLTPPTQDTRGLPRRDRGRGAWTAGPGVAAAG
jgi:hypothetical protein